MREIAEMQARQLVERFTGNLSANLPAVQQPQAKASKDKRAIYLWAGLAVVLSVGLFLIIWALYIFMREN